MSEHDASEPGYTIDQLAARSGIPSRTIRFYQSSGALPKPKKRGRVAFYDAAHLERLELIGRLQDRGLRIRAIKELVERIDKGELALDEWLGLEAQLQSGWAGDEDAPRVVDAQALSELLGTPRPGLIADLVRHDLLEPQEQGRHLVRSPGLLDMALRLEKAGIDIDTAAEANETLRKHMSRAAEDLSRLFVGKLSDQAAPLPDITKTVAELRPVAQESVRLVFAREMERVLRGLVESGAVAKKTTKKTRIRRRR